MANLTKEQRAAKEVEKEAQLKQDLQAQMMADLKAQIMSEMKAEMEQTLRKQIEAEMKEENKQPKEEKVDKKQIAKNMAKTIRIPLDTMIPVTCNTKGSLIYVSKKIAGYTIKWDGFGSTEYMELSELASMRNSDRRFFEDNWIICEDTEDYTALQIYDFLKVTKYYNNIFTPETIDEIFEKTPSDIIKCISGLSKGMKETIAVRAKEKIDAKELDSNNKIKALEDVLGMKFDIFDV